MEKDAGFIHPYVPNAAPESRRKLLNAIGVENLRDLYSSVPEELRVKGLLNLPGSLQSEHDLREHVEKLIAKNQSTKEYLNFCGAGCWQPSVPAICDEITGRGEFLTAYAGGTYSDHGKTKLFLNKINDLIIIQRNHRCFIKHYFIHFNI